jgi:uncharacterized protein (TIGR02453 family)
MPESFFRPELFEFLRQLKRHNNREWFNRNKTRYEDAVRDPALRFISAFGPHLGRISAEFVADARPTRGSLFRIYRDTRFSSDKKPYKTHIGIRFLHQEGKNIHAPIFYLHFEPEKSFAAAGVWHPEQPTLTRIRTAIVERPQQWAAVRRKCELEGDSLARPPRGFDPRHPFIDDLRHKDFVTSIAFTDKQICSDKFLREFAAACKKMSPIVQFTAAALGLKY